MLDGVGYKKQLNDFRKKGNGPSMLLKQIDVVEAVRDSAVAQIKIKKCFNCSLAWCSFIVFIWMS